MKLYFKQRMFSWFDSYDIYHMDDSGAVAFTVEGQAGVGTLPAHPRSHGAAHRHREAAGFYVPAQV